MLRNPIFSRIFALCLVATVPFAASSQVSDPLGHLDLHTLPQGKLGLDTPAFWVRPGYKVSLLAKDLPEARFLEKDDQGAIYLSQPNAGKILKFKDEGAKLTLVSTFLSGKRSVHGMCWSKGWMYYSISGEVRRAQDSDGDGKADKDEGLIGPETYSRGGGHWWRSVLVTSDAIYTSIGDSGNTNDETDSPRQKIWRFGLDGKNAKVFASGLRNTEKLLLRPGTSEVWGMDHGSDNWGTELGESEGSKQPMTDLVVPDEFNRYDEGKFYGHPFLVGNRIPRLEYREKKDLVDLAAKTEPPQWCFGSHWAMNGFCFLTQKRFGAANVGNAICAAHGSWNSAKKVGYRVEMVLFDTVTGLPYGSLALVSTLGKSGDVLARPVDCLELADGSILFSCDVTKCLYRIEPDPKP